jgi:lysylphosphatidylglycerol synthetase-like protein (DUF2156 family)
MRLILLVARRVVEECLGAREILIAAVLFGLGCLLARSSDGPDAASAFAAAVRGIAAGPVLLVGAFLLVFSRAWPAARRSNEISRWLRVLPLPPMARVTGPLLGHAAALACMLVGMGIVGGEFLAFIEPGHPPCREVFVLDPARFTGPTTARYPLVVPTLIRADDCAEFEVPEGTRADRVTLALRVYFAGNEGSVRLRLELGPQRIEIEALAPGPHRVVRDFEPVPVPAVFRLRRLSDAGPPVEVMPRGLEVRTPEERSFVANACAAFLSLLPLAVAAAATLQLLLPVLSRGAAIVTAVLLFALALAFPVTTGGIRLEDLGEGRWIGISGVVLGHAGPWTITAAAVLLASLRRSP